MTTIVGAFAASYYSTITSLYGSLLIFGYIQVFSILLFMILAVVHSHNIAICAVFLESLSNGATSCLLVSLFMNVCNDNDYAASQISFLSAVASLPRVALGPIAGYVAQSCGWVEFFAISTIIAIPGVLLLHLCYNNINSYFIVKGREEYI